MGPFACHFIPSTLWLFVNSRTAIEDFIIKLFVIEDVIPLVDKQQFDLCHMWETEFSHRKLCCIQLWWGLESRAAELLHPSIWLVLEHFFWSYHSSSLISPALKEQHLSYWSLLGGLRGSSDGILSQILDERGRRVVMLTRTHRTLKKSWKVAIKPFPPSWPTVIRMETFQFFLSPFRNRSCMIFLLSSLGLGPV